MTESEDGDELRPQDVLFKKRTLVLNGKLTAKNCGRIGREMIVLQQQSNDRINLVIDSGGGDVHAALKLCDLMSTFIKAPIRGIVLGACGSAATFILLYCDERISTRHSRFLIHSGSWNGASLTIGKNTVPEIESLLKDLRNIEDTIIELYADKLTPTNEVDFSTKAKKRKYVRDLFARGDQKYDGWMTAKEAIEVGLVTTITTEHIL